MTAATLSVFSDPVWERLKSQTEAFSRHEPALGGFYAETVLERAGLGDALSVLLARKLATPWLGVEALRDLFREALADSPVFLESVRRDLSAVTERDPAAKSLVMPFLYFKGFHSLQSCRLTHWLWGHGRRDLAFFLQSRISEVFGVDIHPAAKIGKGIMIDHATSVVIGETAVVGDDVSMLHEVTLGGTGKESGDRHPKIGHGVLIGAGAKILGNIRIGDGSKIAAGSVVLSEVPPHSTVAGIPAKVVGHPKSAEPSLQMDQNVEHDYMI
jgi:serine O-acetyltransferase